MSDAEDSLNLHDEDDVLGVDYDKNVDGSDIGNDDLVGGDDASMDDPVITFIFLLCIEINIVC